MNPSYFLTARQKEIIALKLLGLTHLEIATELSITKSTVNSHILNSLKTLNLKNSREFISVYFPSSLLYKKPKRCRRTTIKELLQLKRQRLLAAQYLCQCLDTIRSEPEGETIALDVIAQQIDSVLHLIQPS